MSAVEECPLLKSAHCYSSWQKENIDMDVQFEWEALLSYKELTVWCYRGYSREYSKAPLFYAALPLCFVTTVNNPSVDCHLV